MKTLLALMMVLTLGFTVVLADPFSDGIAKAHALRKAGDSLGAAQATPRTLCAAFYYWEAACKIVGHKNANNDWAINAKVSDTDKAEGLRLLGLAQEQWDASQAIEKGTAGDDGTCKGVDAATLKTMIENVKACINGHCN